MILKNLFDLLIKNTKSYKGDLFYFIGTKNELNGEDHNLKYPCVFLEIPLTASSTINNNTISSTFNLNLSIFDSISISDRMEYLIEKYDLLYEIIINYIDNISFYLSNSQDNSIESFSVGTITQIIKKQDSNHIGWTMQLTFKVNNEINCCSYFNNLI